ncbi:hypothetical protein NONO_c34770 [Nocardia nova SH22a]|uniref:EvbL n=1 Tax=Nocardia nova SH22a TaxID=1415166 RepID=W5TGG5_9NOCA|nr:hypothetical protein [Nocardia nova]AHH18264.1 hypothetical protein NONO_c34770 [Nocardia nova SH22a]
MSVPAAVKSEIQNIGGAFMFSRETKAFGASTGVDGFIGPYTRGRGGVLGDVDADVVTAAFGFFEPATVRAAWESVSMPPAEAASGYLAACRDFGRRKLAGFDSAERLAELLQTVVDDADVAGVSLFAGWRALPSAPDAPGQVLQLIHCLRELRGGVHLIAVRSVGLAPFEAVLIGGSPLADGPTQARRFGWGDRVDSTEVTVAMRQRWDAAEALTDELIAPAFAGLDEAAGKELVTLLQEAHATVFTR